MRRRLFQLVVEQRNQSCFLPVHVAEVPVRHPCDVRLARRGLLADGAGPRF